MTEEKKVFGSISIDPKEVVKRLAKQEEPPKDENDTLCGGCGDPMKKGGRWNGCCSRQCAKDHYD